MNHTTRATISALTILAGAAAAHAAPVTLVNLPGPIASRGLAGAAVNAVVTTPPLAVAGPWYFVTISGNLTKIATNTRATEACIEVTTPSGHKFVIKPFTTGAFSNTIAVPVDAAAAPAFWTFGTGACTLRFFELFADSVSGPDATWSNLQITLHDGSAQPIPFDNVIGTSAENPDTTVGADLIADDAIATGTFNFPAARVVDKMRFKGYGTAMCGVTSNTAASPLSFVRYTFTAPRADGGGNATWTVAPFEVNATSSSAFDMIVDTPVPVLTGPGYPWTYVATELNAPIADDATVAVVRFGIQPQMPDAPLAADFGVIRSIPALGPVETTPVQRSEFTASPGLVRWYTFTTELPCTAANGYWLDIHTQIPNGSAVLDHEIAVYGTSGTRTAFDDDGGSGNRSLLTFGDALPVRAPIAPAVTPEPRDGHDGSLPAGQHYLAVTQWDANFASSGWYATTTGATTGPIAFEFRTNLPGAGCGPADLGSAGGIPGADAALDNNDFIAFINYFFEQNPIADVGTAGGEPGQDALFDNNDFIVFINHFFAGC